MLTGIRVAQQGQTVLLSVSYIGCDAATRGLRVDGVIRSTAGAVLKTFLNRPAALMRQAADGPAGATALPADEPGECDTLLLNLGVVSLDLLGLQLDLSQVRLDVDAPPGSGNLLGNLLRAVAGRLEAGAPFARIAALVDEINEILHAVSGAR